MGSVNMPAQPPPPDYAAATKEGIYTDIDTLPIRNQINQAAQLGQKVTYTDPVTGETKTADFTGMGNDQAAKQAAQILTDTNAALQRQQLQLRQELGVPTVEQTVAEVKAADPTAYATRQALEEKLLGNLNGSPSQVSPSTALQAAYANLEATGMNAPGNDNRLANLYNSAGGLNANLGDFGQIGVLQGLQGQIASDPGAAPTLQALQRQAAGDTQGARQLGASQTQLGSIYDQATRLPTNFSDAATAALNPALQSALDDYALGGTLNDTQLRDVTNNVRAGQMARGNFLGDASALQEAIQQNAASDALKQQRLQNLLDIQSQVFGQSDALRNESNAAAQQRLATMAGLTGQQTALTSQQEALAQSLRNEQAGYATSAADQTTAQRNQLAALAQQIFGTGNTLQTQQYQQQLQQLGLLGNLAGQDFNQNQAAYNTRLNAAGQTFQGAGAIAANQQQVDNTNYARSQQDLANASAMVLGMPVTNQFGSLQGAQQGAVGFTPISYTPVGQLNQNAGANAANFAQQSFGTNANMWNTQAQAAAQSSQGLTSMLGSLGGMAAMAMI